MSVRRAGAVKLFRGDCFDVLRGLEPCSVDAVVTDPPYGLEFMGREFDRLGDGSSMQVWHERWSREVLRVLKPGGHLLAFGGSRTYHRLACAVEDAGFEIRDCLMWLYGSGFPKSLDVSKAIDKAAGVERDVIAMGSDGYVRRARAMAPGGAARTTVQTLSVPATDEARQWDGWGTALKPAHEPIVLARKPLSESTVAKNVQRWGVGALNVDGCRVATDWATDPTRRGWQGGNSRGTWDGGVAPITPSSTPGHQRVSKPNAVGRWPANVVLSHTLWCEQVGTRRVKSHNPGNKAADGHKTDLSQWRHRRLPNQTNHAGPDGTEEVEAWDCTEDCPVRLLDAQMGTLTSGANPTRRGAPKFRTAYGEFIGQEQCEPARGVDSGGASRFFARFRYEPKASRSERNAGLEEMPAVHRSNGNKWTDQDYRVARGERTPGRESGPRQNDHPTVKPIALMRWLCRLVTPPGGLILDPFVGSGTTGIAAGLEGFDFMGIEQDEHYADLAGRRIAWWTGEQPA